MAGLIYAYLISAHIVGGRANLCIFNICVLLVLLQLLAAILLLWAAGWIAS
jgi:hypothetical protein